MIKLSRVILAIAISVLCTQAWAVAPGGVLKNFKVAHHSKKSAVASSDFQGKVTVINFWATWCAACKVEITEMEDQFRPYFSDKNFNLVFVALDKKPEKAVAWFQEKLKDSREMLRYLYVDPSFHSAEKLALESFPTTFVIDQGGRIAHIEKGFEEGKGSTQKMAKMIDSLLRKRG